MNKKKSKLNLQWKIYKIIVSVHIACGRFIILHDIIYRYIFIYTNDCINTFEIVIILDIKHITIYISYECRFQNKYFILKIHTIQYTCYAISKLTS